MQFIRLLCAAILLSSASASAQTYKLGALEITNPWTRATPKGASVAGGYATITNNGTEPDRLVGGSADAGKRLEIHSMEVDQGVMKMREVKGGLEIKPGDTVELKPGGLHLMFVDLVRPLQKGDRVKGTLVFEKSGKVEVEYQVEAIGAREGSSRRSGPHATH